jgi:DNA-binding transcriptional ArsR family regulator
MPASKANQFSSKEQELAILGRALSHPARVRILSILNEKASVRNVDLIKPLRLSKSTIQNHVKKLDEAGLVKIDFFMNCFHISKSPNADFKLESYLNFNEVLKKG